MTTDSIPFAARGNPTVEQIKAVWDSTPEPSSRKVAEILQRRGFEVSMRTVARRAAESWSRSPTASGPRTLTAARQVELIEAVMTAPPPPPTPPNPPVAPTSPVAESSGPKDPDARALLEARRQELMMMSEGDLRELEAKTRVTLNIVLMEQATRQAEVMMLIPKDTGAFVVAMTDAAGAQRLQADPQSARDVTPAPQTIEGEVNPVSLAIARVRKKFG